MFGLSLGLGLGTLAGTESNMQLISTHDLSTETLDSGNEIAVDVSGYTEIRIMISGAACASGDNIIVLFSANSGSTYRTTSGDYKQSLFNDVSKTAPASVANAHLAGGGGGTTSLFGNVTITGLNQSSHPVYATGHSGGASDQYFLSHYTTNLEAVDYIKIQSSGGNAFTAGNLTIYGS